VALKIKGVTYDVGMPVIRGGMTRETLPPDVVEREMRIIRRELNCNAVRITGMEIGRLETAAHIAAEQGLEVWLSPMRHDADERETFDGVMRAARVCEELRKKHDVRVVLVIGCELSIFMAGLIPGNNAFERLALLSDPSRWTEELFAQGSPIERLNGFLARTQAEAEKRFSGPITYAAGLWEDIDWSRALTLSGSMPIAMPAMPAIFGTSSANIKSMENRSSSRNSAAAPTPAPKTQAAWGGT
jgi:hypothetical protein